MGLDRVLKNVLYIGHKSVAHVLKIQELELDETEAKMLAEAVNDVASEYEVRVSEKAEAWVNLATVLGTTYGTRIYAYKIRMTLEQAQRGEVSPDGPG